MDDHGNSSSYTCCQGEQEKISYLLGHIPTSLSSYSSICAVRSQMPSSSSCPISDGDGDGGRKSLDQDFDSLDCESEEGLEVFEESVKPALTRTSGSKRSRAAEVHNMSEKRRRSRINEKMRALQNLIPNSNKTDKASMLDEAIEYLKQLQLQVQILSMRNGLNLQSMYLSGALQPLQTSQMCIGFGLDSDTAMNIATAILPLNQDSAAQSSFVLPNQCAPSHQSTGASSLINVTDPEATLVNSSQSIHGSFQVPVSCEIFAGDMSAPTQLDVVHYTRNLTENERTSIAIDAKQLGVPVSSRIGINHLEEGMLGTEERSEEMPSDEENFIQHLHGLEKLFKVLIQKNIEISEVARSALLTNTEVFKAKRFRLIHIRSCNYACLF